MFDVGRWMLDVNVQLHLHPSFSRRMFPCDGCHQSNTMKTLRPLLAYLLLATLTGVLPGCATAPPDPPAVATGINGIEKKQPSPTADMTGIEKTGYYLGWLSLDAIYAWAGGNQPASPWP